MKKTKSIVAKVILITSAIVGISPFMVLISLPLYIIGVILIGTSKSVNTNDKILWVIIPLIVVSSVWILIKLSTLF